ncbi:hypothetical protein EVAR_99336_1 [Eumeta japonica]|uniref:Uncharacterized protein n=1 Tax=Eumeta variegata TaxID=151549 RepID=A0A4C1ZJH8_EUMVA|nr:hypothetical protein EVAR_99336_1 [Eumeta japonica]
MSFAVRQNHQFASLLPTADELKMASRQCKHDVDSFCFICGEFIKLHMLHSHLDEFKDNVGAYSEEQGERFHQDVMGSEWRYQGQYNENMMRHVKPLVTVVRGPNPYWTGVVDLKTGGKGAGELLESRRSPPTTARLEPQRNYECVAGRFKLITLLVIRSQKLETALLTFDCNSPDKNATCEAETYITDALRTFVQIETVIGNEIEIANGIKSTIKSRDWEDSKSRTESRSKSSVGLKLKSKAVISIGTRSGSKIRIETGTRFESEIEIQIYLNRDRAGNQKRESKV